MDAKSVCRIRPIKKFLYFILVSVMILFVCMCTEMPPKEIKKIIISALCMGCVIRLVKKIPLVRSNMPFIITYSRIGKFI